MATLPTTDQIRIGKMLAADLRETVTDAHREIVATTPWEKGYVIERGKDHSVLLVPDHVVVRYARDPARDVERLTRLADQLARVLPWQVPVSWAVSSSPAPAVLQPFLHGTAHPNHEGDPAVLKRIVQTLAEVDVNDLDLAEPFVQRGGPTEQKLRALAEAETTYQVDGLLNLATQVAELVTDWSDPATAPEVGLVHGDLAGHNMLWLPPSGSSGGAEGWQLNAILDWDQAAAWDPALNSAMLSLWHGAELLPEITTDAEQLRRARIWSGSLALESLQDAVSSNRPAPSVRRLLRKIGPRLEAARVALEAGIRSLGE